MERPYRCTAEYQIRTYEIDSRKQATVTALVKLMHETAMQNVIDMKLSVWDLEPRQISWVLMKKYVNIDRLPRLGEKITVETYPAGFEKFFTFRDYKVYDAGGRLIAHSGSTWLLMDTLIRRMTRIPDFILEYGPAIETYGDFLPRPQGKLPAMERVDHRLGFRVYWHDLDFNQHLNNTYYVQWMLEAVPPHLLQSGQLRSLDILYRLECHWQQEVIAETQQLNEGEFLHRLVLAEDGREVASAKTDWM